MCVLLGVRQLNWYTFFIVYICLTYSECCNYVYILGSFPGHMELGMRLHVYMYIMSSPDPLTCAGGSGNNINMYNINACAWNVLHTHSILTLSTID